MVGRERELATLHAGFREASIGRGGFILLSGEPGIGKTRLAEAFAATAVRRGGVVLWGRAFNGDGVPAFWPWVQALRDLSVHLTGAGAVEVARIITELGPDPAEPIPRLLEPQAARFRLFDRITGHLREAARRSALVAVFDDLHWADPPSLSLLRFVGGDLPRMRLLVVATHRDVEITENHDSAQMLAEVARQPGSCRIPLRGLDAVEVSQYMDDVAGRAVPPALAMRVHAETEGNPFFVSEVVRVLAADGRLVGNAAWQTVLPPTVRSAIRVRLDGLSAECKAVLDVAAVIGREFEAAALARLCGRGGLVELLDEAVAAAVVVPVPGVIGRYRFVHALVRETLYEELTPASRRRFHLQVGEALAELAGPDGKRHLAEIAHHLLEALPDGNSARAVSLLVRAAEHAAQLLAYEEAVRLYDAAHRAADTYLAPDQSRRCEVLLGLGEALMRCGRVADAEAVLREAAELARGLASGELLSRAALSLAGPWPTMGVVNRELIALCAEAAAGAPPALRVRLLARSAIELYFGGDGERRRTLSEQAMTLAARTQDQSALAHALVARHWALYGPDHLTERLKLADDMLRLAEQVGDEELELQGRHWRIVDLLEFGAIADADVEIAAYGDLAERLAHPFARWQLALRRGLRALLDGRLADAEQLIDDAYALGRRQDPRTAAGYFGCQRFQLLREQGRLDEATTDIARLVERTPAVPGIAALLATVYAETGHPEQARLILARLSSNGFAALSRDYCWLGAMVLLAEVCAQVDEAGTARRVLTALRPYASRAALFGRPSFCLGSVARPLGILAGMLGQFHEAERFFEQALAANAAMGAATYVAHTNASYAHMLRCSGGRRNTERAAQISGRAAATAAEVGMSRLLTPPSPALAPAPAGLTCREVEVLRLLAAGRSNSQIAHALGISVNTVLRHVTHILTKTGSTNRTQAAHFASRHGVVGTP
jgi:DNA-binding CsgD family transcriptional regulator/tetratricopeptide (TPR) repeat protein